MRRSALLVLPLLLAAGLLGARPAFAQLPTLVPEACQGYATLQECGLNEAVQVFINVAQFIFGISGSAALLMFIWGGFLWLTSAGNAEKVKQGQAVITGAVVGLIIIFGAYVGVQFLVGALRGTVAPGDVVIPGERCGEGAEAGLAVETASGLTCIPFGQCGRIGEGWTETTLTDSTRSGHACVDGLLPDEPENVKCCRAIDGTAGAGGTSSAGEGTSGRNNCTCADRGVQNADRCATCFSYCTTTRRSTMVEYNGDIVGSCDDVGTCSATCTGSACLSADAAGPRCTEIGGTFTAPGTCDFPRTYAECDAFRASVTNTPDRVTTVIFVP